MPRSPVNQSTPRRVSRCVAGTVAAILMACIPVARSAPFGSGEGVLGACCVDRGCTIETPVKCDMLGGSYRGDDTTCTGVDCEPLRLACAAVPLGGDLVLLAFKASQPVDVQARVDIGCGLVDVHDGQLVRIQCDPVGAECGARFDGTMWHLRGPSAVMTVVAFSKADDAEVCVIDVCTPSSRETLVPRVRR